MRHADVLDRLRERVRVHPTQRTVGVGGGVVRAAPRAAEEQVLRTETRLGFDLPPLLRRIYLEVANGGFGPGYGVMGAEGGFADDMGATIAECFETYRRGEADDPAWLWPRAHVPICHWGCIVYSVVDCGTTGNPVYWADIGAKEPGEPMSTIVRPHKATLDEWLRDWLDGRDLWKDRART